MKTWLGHEIPENILGILYICNYHSKDNTLEVVHEIGFLSAFDALEAYANIANPESQMASGKDKESFEKDLQKLHDHLNDPEWVKELSGYL